MPLDKPCADWLSDLTKKAVENQLEDDNASKKKAELSHLAAEVGKYAEDAENEKSGRGIRGVEVTRQRNILPDERMSMLDYKDRDQTEEFDIDELEDGWGVNPKDLERVADLLNTADKWVKEMRAKTVKVKVKKPAVPGPGEIEVDEIQPMFTAQEIRDEVYTPLVRRGVLPETMVPDEFSETKKMIEGSFEAYGDRLKSEKVKEGVKNFLSNNHALIMNGLGAVAAGFSSGVMAYKTFDKGGLHGSDRNPTYEDFTNAHNQGQEFWDKKGQAWLDSWHPDPTSTDATSEPGDYYETIWPNVGMLADEIGYGSDLVNKGFDIHEAREGRRAPREAAEEMEQNQARVQQGPRLVQAFMQAVSAHMATAFAEAHAALAVSAGSVLGSSIKPSEVLEEIRGDDPLEPLAKAEGLVHVFEHGYKQAMLTCGKQIADATLKKNIEDSGPRMAAAFKAACPAHKLLEALNASGGELAGKSIKLVSDGGKAAADDVKADLKAWLAVNAAGIDAITHGIDEEMIKEFEKSKKKTDEECKKELEQLQAETDVEQLAGIVEKKTAELKRSAGTIKLFMTVAGMTVDQAAKFFGPLGMIGSGMKLIQNAYEANKRWKDWTEFSNSRGDMLRAASAYSAPVKNFVDNAAKQWANYSFTAVMEGIKIAGAVMQCSGFGLVVGMGLQSAASTAEAIESFLVEVGKKLDLRAGWNTYKLALTRPANRKIALIAMRKNSTLAKYSVAYGAVIRKDPLVSDFMSKCGLDEASLRDPRAKLDKVVAYLEARLPDDVTVVGMEEAPEGGWAPTKVELTLMCWNTTRTRAEAANDVPKTPTNNLDRALARFESLHEHAQEKLKNHPADDDTKVILEKCADSLDSIREELVAYVGVIDSQSPEKKADSGMRRVVKMFRQEINHQMKELKINELTSRKALADDAAAQQQAAAGRAI